MSPGERGKKNCVGFSVFIFFFFVSRINKASFGCVWRPPGQSVEVPVQRFSLTEPLMMADIQGQFPRESRLPDSHGDRPTETASDGPSPLNDPSSRRLSAGGGIPPA